MKVHEAYDSVGNYVAQLSFLRDLAEISKKLFLRDILTQTIIFGRETKLSASYNLGTVGIMKSEFLKVTKMHRKLK